MSKVIPIQGRDSTSPRSPIEHDPMDDPTTRCDHYLSEASRMITAAAEARDQIRDPYEQGMAGIGFMRVARRSLEAGFPPSLADDDPEPA